MSDNYSIDDYYCDMIKDMEERPMKNVVERDEELERLIAQEKELRQERDAEPNRLLKEEEEIEALVRKNQVFTFSHAQEEKHSLLSHLAWLSGEAVMKEDAETLLAIATVVKFTRGLT